MGAAEGDEAPYRAEMIAGTRVHAKTFMVLASVGFVYVAQLVALIGSGLLVQPLTLLFQSPAEGVWFGTVINILLAVLGPPACQLADYWGRRWTLVILTVFGLAGSMVIGRAESMNTAIAGWTILAVSAPGAPLVFAIASEVLPRNHRPYAQVLVNAFANCGAIIGLLMGGALLNHGDWGNFRTFMYVLAGFYGFATVGVGLFYNPPPRELQLSLRTKEKLGKLDWVGNALLAPGLVLFCVSLSWYKNPYPFSTVRVFVTSLIGIILVIAFGIYEWRFTKEGILNHRLFRDRNFPLAVAVIFVEGAFFYTVNAYFILQINLMTGQNLLTSVCHLVVTFGVSFPSMYVAGYISAKYKTVRWPTIVGFVVILVGIICLATSTTSTVSGAYWAFAVLIGAGIGTILPSIVVVAQLSTPADLISETSGLLLASRAVGSVVGLAVNNAIFNGTLADNLTPKVARAVLPLGMPESSLPDFIAALMAHDQAALQHIPGATVQIIGAGAAGMLEAYGIAFRNAWILSAGLCFLAVIGSCFFFDPKSEFTTHIDAPAEEEVAKEQARIEGAQLNQASLSEKDAVAETRLESAQGHTSARDGSWNAS